MKMFKLRFDKNEIQHWASHYQYEKEDFIEYVVSPRIKTLGYASKQDFVALCEWKSKRPRKRYASNAEDFIRAATYTALSTPNERLRIEVLTLLSGVSWPMCSVFLHFCHSDSYPILDFRALWSLSVDTPPPYTFELWGKYTEYCRNLSQKYSVSMRTLDRALWQYSKEHQKPT